MPFESPERPTEFHIDVEPQRKPAPLGFLLVLLAIGLALSPSRAIKALLQFDQPAQSSFEMALTAGQLAIAAWSVVNLVWLVKRRRRFPGSMIALFVFSILLTILETGSVMLTDPELRLPMALATALGIAVASMWIAYLSRSKHVREVFVR